MEKVLLSPFKKTLRVKAFERWLDLILPCRCRFLNFCLPCYLFKLDPLSLGESPLVGLFFCMP